MIHNHKTNQTAHRLPQPEEHVERPPKCSLAQHHDLPCAKSHGNLPLSTHHQRAVCATTAGELWHVMLSHKKTSFRNRLRYRIFPEWSVWGRHRGTTNLTLDSQKSLRLKGIKMAHVGRVHYGQAWNL